MHLTAKERILLYLLENLPVGDGAEVSAALTREEIARASWISTRHLPQYVRPLVREGLVHQRQAHVEGIRQRRNVYDLTDTGKRAARQLREELKSERIRVRDSNGIREITVSGALGNARANVSLLDVFRTVSRGGPLDLPLLPPPRRRSLVEMISDAPRVQGFVGREDELDLLTADGEGPPMVIVRGIAGIGKSSLAAKACELLRGRRNLFWHTIQPWDTRESVLAHLGEFLSAVGRPGLRSVLSRRGAGVAPEVVQEDLPGGSSFLVFDDAEKGSPEILAFFRVLMSILSDAGDVRALALTRQTLRFYDRRDVVLKGLVRELELRGLRIQETQSLTERDAGARVPNTIARKLGGHPLLLELARSALRSGPSAQPLADVRTFLEEQVYEELPTPAKRVMKLASQYEVPVPRDALFPDTDTPLEVILDLTHRSLIQSVGVEGFEAHETIRDFFGDTLTPFEHQEFARLARSHLVRLARMSERTGRRLRCVDFLSNAIRLSSTPEERTGLLEAQGDASAQIGDLPGALTAFKRAIAEAEDSETRVRLRRKSASILCDRVQLASAAAEISKALAELGERESVERGWIDLISGELDAWKVEPQEANGHLNHALRTFRAFHAVRGEAEALLRLGRVACLLGGDLSSARDRLENALSVSETLEDAAVAASAHLWLGILAAFGMGNVEEATGQFDAAETVAAANEDHLVRLTAIRYRGWMRLHLQMDLLGAEACFAESLRLARKCHSVHGMTGSSAGMAAISFYRGDWKSARDGNDALSAELAGADPPVNRLDSEWTIALCSLLLNDLERFEQVVRQLDKDRSITKSGVGLAVVEDLQGLRELTKGNLKMAKVTLRSALRRSETTYPIPLKDYVYAAPFLYSLSLRVEGRESEADSYMDRAKAILQRAGRSTRLSQLPDLERRILEVLRQVYRGNEEGGRAAGGN